MEAEGELNAETSAFQQIVASCSGAFLTSLLVTPLDVVKVRLQKQVKVVKRSPSARSKGVTPLDVVKVRLQSQKATFTPGRAFLYSNGLMDHICTCSTSILRLDTSDPKTCPWYNRPGRFTGTADALLKIARHEGISSLWSGLSPTLVMAVPATVCYFTLYDNLNLSLQRRFGPDLRWSMTAGALARVAVVSLVSPLEMMRTKMQSEKMGYGGIWDILKSMVRSQGIRSLYIGWAPTILRDVPFSAIYWGGYEYCKRSIMKELKVDQTNFSISFVSGAIAGSVAAMTTLPFDVIKTHRQVEIGEIVAAHAEGVRKPHSTLYMMRRLYNQHGLSALFSGAVPRLIKIAPACAIMIGTYEYLKLFFKRRNARGRQLLQ